MSEAFADAPYRSGYKRLEPRALIGLINNWFERVVEAIPPEKYLQLGAGDTAPLHEAPGIGRIVLHYKGSRYLPTNPALGRDTETPLQRCEYTLAMSEYRTDRSPEESEPLGWWMPLHMEYGPKLAIDQPASVEELLGSSNEKRQKLEAVLSSLVTAYTAPVADVVPMKP